MDGAGRVCLFVSFSNSLGRAKMVYSLTVRVSLDRDSMGRSLLPPFSARYRPRSRSVSAQDDTRVLTQLMVTSLFFFNSILDAQARLLIPSLPPLRPNDRISHHYRFIAPLMPKDDEGRTPLHYYDSAIQLARQAEREPTEREFEVGITAADEIKKMYVGNIFCQFLWIIHTCQVFPRPERKCLRARPPTSASFPLRYDTHPNLLFLHAERHPTDLNHKTNYPRSVKETPSGVRTRILRVKYL